MRLRKLLLPVVGLAGAGMAALPTLAAGSSPPDTASFKAVDFAWQANGGTGTKATIAPGGTVTFSYPSGTSFHNADFGSGPAPTSCTQTAGAPSGSTPPLPHMPTPAGWRGTCTFNSPGTYTFHCDLHNFMTATIVVQASGSTTTTGTTSTQTAPSGPGTPTSHGKGSPLAGRAAHAVVVAANQRGSAVEGFVRVSSAGAGGRLTVALFAARAALAGGAGGSTAQKPVRVGHLVVTGVHAGKVRFSVRLDRAARRALSAKGRLTLTTVVTVMSRGGRKASVRRHVVLRRR